MIVFCWFAGPSEGNSDASQTQSKPSCSYQNVIVDGRAASRISKGSVMKTSSPVANQHNGQGSQNHRKRPSCGTRHPRRSFSGSGYWSPQQVESECPDDVEQAPSNSRASSSNDQSLPEHHEREHQKQQQQVRDEHSYPEQAIPDPDDTELSIENELSIVEAEISSIMEESLSVLGQAGMLTFRVSVLSVVVFRRCHWCFNLTNNRQ